MSVAASKSLAAKAAPAAAAPTPLIAIVGNPNSGKTTIFNLLTGLKQKVANYPGVTVEKKVGECYSQHGKVLRLIDLPGTYSLNARSPDEAVARDVLLGRRADTPRPDRVVCIVDASNLERNLYLLTQVLELGLPTLLVLNMMDVAEKKGWRIDDKKLAEMLGIPVVLMQATTGRGLLDLKVAMSREDLSPSKWHSAPLPADIAAALAQSRDALVAAGAVHPKASLLEPLYLLSDHDPLHYGIQDEHMQLVNEGRGQVEAAFPGWEDELVAERYEAIGRLTREVLQEPDEMVPQFSAKLDRVLLHPFWGGVFAVGVMCIIFYLIFSVSETPKGWIESGFGWLEGWVAGTMSAGDLRELIIQGALKGVAGVLVFLPQIMILFFFIGIMEDTGYMARLAFLMDRLMGSVGLNGKAFLPVLNSYACAIPGIMAARTIASPKDRLITILIAPLASCSARLPVYTLLVGVLLPATVSNWIKSAVMIGLYALGTLTAFGFAWLFNRHLMKGANSPMILEMPTYKRPSLRSVLLQMLLRANMFVKRAGTVILAISILIWAASTYPKDAAKAAKLDQNQEQIDQLKNNKDAAAIEKVAALKHENAEIKAEQSANSFAGKVGHFIEPVIKPLGYDWKIGIGLFGSFAAREVFGTTMAIVYAVENDDEEDPLPLQQRLQSETRADGTPVYTPLVCASLLVFYVYAMMCMSTMVVVKRETNSWKWALFQFGYMTSTAYLASLLVFQIGSALGF